MGLHCKRINQERIASLVIVTEFIGSTSREEVETSVKDYAMYRICNT